MKKNDLELLNKITKNMKIAKNTAVKVGIASDVGSYNNGQSILAVAERHEYGLGQARRSFIRTPMIKETPKIQKALKQGFLSIQKGGDTLVNLNKLGIIAQNISQNSFKNQGFGEWKDIRESTKKAKGSSKILFDTGRLVGSIKYWTVKI
jgi:hypothetical protein